MKRLFTLILALVMAFSLTACGGAVESAKAVETAATEEQQISTEKAVEAEEAAKVEEPVKTEESSKTEDTKTQETTGTISFTDDCGRTVEIPADISRIVPSGGLAQIAVFAIAPEMFVGLAGKWSESAKEYVAADYFDLPVLGALYGSADLNVEELAATEPQLIIDLGEAKKTIVEDMDSLQEQTAIPSIHIEATLATMADAYRKLGSILGKEERAEQIAAMCERVYSRTMDIMDKVGENKISALYVLGEEGLNVIANGSFHAEVFDLLTNNVAVVENPSGKGSGNEVTMEQIAIWDPDFIVFDSGSIFETVTEMDTWKDMKAVTNKNFVEVPYGPDNWMGMPPSVQRYLSMIWLPAVLYPEYCDYDVKEEVKECYRLLYSCDLTDEQYDSLTANAFLRG